MNVMTPEFFEKYWKLLGATEPMTDPKRCHLKHLLTRKGKVLQAMRLRNGGGADEGLVLEAELYARGALQMGATASHHLALSRKTLGERRQRGHMGALIRGGGSIPA